MLALMEFPIMFHARGVWLMVVALQGVKTWAVVQTLALPLAICQIVPLDKPTRQTAI